MHLTLLALLLAGCSSVVPTAALTTHAQTPAAFIPSGYRLLPHGRATGDLNGDGRPDVVLALGPVAEDSAQADELLPRLLLVLWRTAGGYRLAATARQALLGKYDGGVIGDPFEGVRIEKGVLSVRHYGGGGWQWSVVSKFRYQQGDFYLIGATYSQRHNVEDECPNLGGDHRPGDKYRDENLLTGAFVSAEVSQDCQLLENKHGKQPLKPLRRLVAYHP